MRVLVGTSGYAYREWKGRFYPDKLPAKAFLRYYVERLPTVEINSTFYRLPEASVVQGWANDAPEGFTFAMKAPQRITHHLRLKGARAATNAFVKVSRLLGPRLGPLLFQVPPFFQKDLRRLTSFLKVVPSGHRVAFEFRHASWFDDDVWAILRARGAALCVAEGEELASPLTPTADWGYVRLRKDAYTRRGLARWAARIRELPWKEAFVYVKHDEGAAPGVARRLAELIG